jgi:nucleoside-diphosphate-sugar epimerase
MARCLVTGHKGYIGSKLYKRLLDLGHEVEGIDLDGDTSRDVRSTLSEDTDGKFHPHFTNFEPEYIFHLACWPRVVYCMEDPVSTMENNVIAGTTVLNFAKKCPSVKRVIYSSSSSIVGNGAGPTNPYALQKYVTELECGIYAALFGLDTVSLRYFNVYSEDQKASGPYATAVANWMEYIRTNKTPFITGDGEQRRDMIHVDDVVSANVFAMNHEDRFDGAVYDIGTGDNISLNEIKDIAQTYHDIEFDYTAARLGDVIETRANTQKLKNIGWEHSISIKEGIDSCFKNTQTKELQ